MVIVLSVNIIKQAVEGKKARNAANLLQHEGHESLFGDLMLVWVGFALLDRKAFGGQFADQVLDSVCVQVIVVVL
jgi:hypothetical protein